jgi:hypothetical protein
VRDGDSRRPWQGTNPAVAGTCRRETDGVTVAAYNLDDGE